MYKILLVFLLFFISTISYSQHSSDINQRKGNLFFSAGVDYRITPIYKGFSNIDLPVSVDLQNSGLGFNFNFDYFLSKNLSLGLGNTLRYDMVSSNFDEITDIAGFTKVNNDLIFDIHVYLDYHLIKFKKGELFIRFGKSLRNNGAQYAFRDPVFDQNGNYFASLQGISVTPSHSAWNFALGYKNKRVSLMLGVFTTSFSGYFSPDKAFIVPYFSITYNLGKL